MPDIRVLPETLSNQIAAGEVVSRPSAVVKELVENSLDAGASAIRLEVEGGGKKLIRVSDDGAGMSSDNALLSLERYATSKIYTKEDLASISTMGFRGEAVPSIASVSRFTLTTREHSSDTATRIEVAGGKIMNVCDAGAPAGTMVQVRDLFFNTPARRKFLKADNTEMSHIADTFSGIALGNLGVRFSVFRENKRLKDFDARDSLCQRAVNVLGRDAAGRLIEVDRQDGFIRVSGFVSDPSLTRSNSKMLWLFANRRMISDRSLSKAVFSGYRGRIMKGRFPLAVLFIDLPYGKMDVNVHPSKLEVRFFDGNLVYRAVEEAVREALDRDAKRSVSSAPSFSAGPGLKSPRVGYEHAGDGIDSGQQSHLFQRGVEAVEQPLPEFGTPGTGKRYKTSYMDDIARSSDSSGKEKIPGEPRMAEETGENTAGLQERQTMPYAVKGQVMNTYIVAESNEGLVILDQHAAHERIVYEDLKRKYERSAAQAQFLAVPETVDLKFAEADLLSTLLQDLERLGLVVEPFGGTTFIIKSLPAAVDYQDPAGFLLEMLDNLSEKGGGVELKENFHDELLILTACHSAIRAGQPLSEQEMNRLVQDLVQCVNPLTCPHGRPTILKWTGSDMEKLFRRTV
ncbi:MAG: DNA mismatch repair endonuclease MutL [Thermodesulfobacteriota bacterium]